jgi:DNA-binding NarL/FixJ family response regulator
MACRVLIVDDNEDMRYLTAAFLDTDEGGIDLVGVANDGRQAVALVRQHRPDVVLLDLVLERENGLDVAEQILHLQPDAAIVLFSEFLDGATTRRAERIGVRECVPKDQFQRLPEVVREHCPSS